MGPARLQMKSAGMAAGLAILGLVACRPTLGSPSPAAASPSTVASRPPVSPTPTPAGLLPRPTRLASVFGTCRLPVFVDHEIGETPGGWLDVPSGTYTPDPQTMQAGSSFFGQVAWDPAVGRWVPTLPTWISPDGTKYVDAGIEIVDARTGAILHRFSKRTWPNTVIGYTNTAIYLVARGKAPPPGLWKIDTASWTLTQISSAKGDWDLANDTAVWGTYPSAAGDVLRRLDLSTGAISVVYRSERADQQVRIAGLTGSDAVVTVYRDDASGIDSVVIVHPDRTAVALDIPLLVQLGGLGDAFQDGPTVLFWAAYRADPSYKLETGLAAYDPEHGLQLVMMNITVSPIFEGRCVTT
jgi:hypothetical protein